MTNFSFAKKNNGFTLAELLIVVAIIAVLVGIGIPIFSSQLEKSREAVDIANARSAYGTIMVEVLSGNISGNGSGDNTISATIPLKQTVDGWTTDISAIIIGGVQGSESDTEHWKGMPGKGGTCEISYSEETGIVFNWSGGSGEGGQSDINTPPNFGNATGDPAIMKLVDFLRYCNNNLDETTGIAYGGYPNYLKVVNKNDSIKNTFYSYNNGDETSGAYVKNAIKSVYGDKADEIITNTFPSSNGGSSNSAQIYMDKDFNVVAVFISKTGNSCELYVPDGNGFVKDDNYSGSKAWADQVTCVDNLIG